MKQTLTIDEYQSPIWTYCTLFSGAITIIFFALFWFTDDALWTGIFRLIAFAGFAGLVLAGLRLREKPKRFDIQTDKKRVLVSYFQNNERLKEEEFERETIKDIYNQSKQPAWDLFGISDGYKIYITFTDTSTRLSMFTFSGRDLYVSEQDAARLDAFFAEHNLTSA